MMYSEMETAKEWGLSPHEWAEKDREERAMMVAFERVRAKIEQVQIEESRNG